MGGGQRCLLEAAMGFRERGWDVLAAVPSGGAFAQALEPYCRELHNLPCGPFTSGTKGLQDGLRFAYQLPQQIVILARITSRARVDVIFVNGPRVMPAAALARGARPLIYHAHWMPEQPVASTLTRRALRWSGASAVAPSVFAARWLQTAMDPDRISTVYNGVRALKPPLLPKAGSTRLHVAVLGRISPEKGQLEFARAVRIVTSQIQGLSFTICGGSLFGDQHYCDAVRAESQGCVRFKDWTEDVPSFLQTVDLLVVPSRMDHAPRVILEAFAARVPVLAFASGAIPELIEHGETGLLVQEQTPQALAQAILFAAGRTDLLEEIARRAYSRWKERYTLSRFQSEICDAVESTLRRHHQHSPLKSAGASAPA
jgi:glycosyltransferase involved in cell wall biosynthesis